MVSDASDDELASQPSGLRKSTCIAAANATSSTESKEEDEEGEDGDEEDQDPVEEDEEEAHRVHVHQRCNDTGISQAFQGLGLRASSKSVHGVVLGQPDGQGITPKLSLSDIASGTRAFWGKFGCHDWNVKHVFNLFLMINIFLATLGRSMAKPAGVGGPTFDFTEDDKVSVNSNGQWRSALVQAFKLMFGLVEHEVEEVWRIMVLSMTKAAPSWKCFYKGKNGDKKICRMWWCMAVGYKLLPGDNHLLETFADPFPLIGELASLDHMNVIKSGLILLLSTFFHMAGFLVPQERIIKALELGFIPRMMDVAAGECALPINPHIPASIHDSGVQLSLLPLVARQHVAEMHAVHRRVVMSATEPMEPLPFQTSDRMLYCGPAMASQVDRNMQQLQPPPPPPLEAQQNEVVTKVGKRNYAKKGGTSAGGGASGSGTSAGGSGVGAGAAPTAAAAPTAGTLGNDVAGSTTVTGGAAATAAGGDAATNVVATTAAPPTGTGAGAGAGAAHTAGNPPTGAAPPTGSAPTGTGAGAGAGAAHTAGNPPTGSASPTGSAPSGAGAGAGAAPPAGAPPTGAAPYIAAAPTGPKIVPLPVTIPTASVPSPAAGKRPSETSPKARDRSKKAKPASSATAIGGATPKSIKPEEAPPEAAPAVADEYSLEDAQLDLLDMLTPVVEFAVSPANDGGQVLVKWLESFETLEQLQSSSGGLLSEGSMGQKLVNHAYAVKHDTEKCRKLLKGLGILR